VNIHEKNRSQEKQGDAGQGYQIRDNLMVKVYKSNNYQGTGKDKRKEEFDRQAKLPEEKQGHSCRDQLDKGILKGNFPLTVAASSP